MQIKHNKASDTNSFQAENYQIFWEITKDDLMMLFIEFHDGNLPLHSLNFGIIALVQKFETDIDYQPCVESMPSSK